MLMIKVKIIMTLKFHLAEMIALLGPPPQSLIARAQLMMKYTWPQTIKREDGKICKKATDCFDGPFFDEDGTLTPLPENQAMSCPNKDA
jgi:hypothetical protein